ncbi:hypothetical protein C8R45DRAFT_947977 [Mycena sanguinolenta]|nr:hypothetical protein C8R45DRAFT_947977 [Mycena sanguinolenta]
MTQRYNTEFYFSEQVVVALEDKNGCKFIWLAKPRCLKTACGWLAKSPPAYNDNPWSYGAPSAQPGANANNRTPLLPQDPSPHLRENSKTWSLLSVLIACILFILGVGLAWEWMQRSPEAALDPATRARMRLEWDKEIKGHEAIRRAWVAEVAAHDTASAEWEAEHAALVAMREQLMRDKEAWRAEKRADERHKEEEHAALVAIREQLVRDKEAWRAEKRADERHKEEEHAALVAMREQLVRDKEAWRVEKRADERKKEEEHAALVAMREQLVRDKEAWRAEKRADERHKEEEQERLRASFYWENLRAEQHCLRHGARRYSARVANVPREYDPVKACKETAVEIHGVKIPSPTQCEDKGCGGVFGHWTVDYLEPTCITHFDDFNDKHIESRLWNLQSGDDWRDMCSTTPANFRGLHLESPEICENWGIQGVWGYWNIEDSACS